MLKARSDIEGLWHFPVLMGNWDFRADKKICENADATSLLSLEDTMMSST